MKNTNKLTRILITSLFASTGLGSANAATIITLDVGASVFTEDSVASTDYGVIRDGNNLRVYDQGGFLPNSGDQWPVSGYQTITAPTSDILNYQIDFVNTTLNATGAANTTVLEIGDGSNAFARVAISFNTGTTTFGRLSGYVTDGSAANVPLTNGQAVTNGTQYAVSLFLNNTGGSLDYTDPLGNARSLADGNYEVWFGEASSNLSLIHSGTGEQTVTGLDTVGFHTAAGGGVENETIFSPIPEPTTLVLMALFGPLALFNRKRLS